MERSLRDVPEGLPGKTLLLILALAMAIAALASQARLAVWADDHFHDFLARQSPQRPAPQGVVILDIDERSLAEIGPWPWPRPVLAELVSRLRDAGARLQVWDLLTPEAAPGDAKLRDAIDAPDIIWGQVPVVDPTVQSPPHAGSLRSQARAADFCSVHAPITGHLGVAEELSPRAVGHLGAMPDLDGQLRRIPAQLCDETRRYPQLIVAAAQALEPDAEWMLQTASNPFGPDRWLVRGALEFPLDRKGQIRVPFHRPHTAWPAVSAARVLEPGSSSVLALRGAVVIVGATALGASDTVSTPFHPRAPGVSVHAELLGAALERSWIVEPRLTVAIAATLAGVLGAMFLPYAPRRGRVGFLWGGLLAAVVLPTLAALVGRFAGVALPVFAPAASLASFVLGLMLLRVLVDRAHTLQLVSHLESFLPRALAREVVQQNPSGQSLGKPCQGVLLALRIVGLERWIVSVDSLQALALLHAIATLAERAASARGGALEHVQGETFLMAWPHADAAGVDAAIAAASALAQELRPLLERNEDERHPLRACAAIESGAFLLGIAGSRASRRPLLLGPAADITLAMLALSDELASPLLVGAQAAALATGAELQELGRFLLPDSATPRALFRAPA